MGAKRIAWVTFIRSVPPPPPSPRRSSSRDCRIVEGVRPFRRRLSSVKPFTRRRMPKREMHAWPVHLPTRGRCCARDRTCSVDHAPVAPSLHQAKTCTHERRRFLTPSGSRSSSSKMRARCTFFKVCYFERWMFLVSNQPKRLSFVIVCHRYLVI